MSTYYRKPSEILAKEITFNNIDELQHWCMSQLSTPGASEVFVPTLDGVLTGEPGDFIVQHATGAFEILSPDKFHSEYVRALQGES